MSDVVLSVLMLAGFLLVGGGIAMLVKRRDRTKAILMIVCGLVLFGNVAILTI